MKHTELANRLGISKSYLSMIISGKRRCPPELADKISSQKSVNFEAMHLLHTQGVTSSSLVPPTMKPGDYRKGLLFTSQKI